MAAPADTTQTGHPTAIAGEWVRREWQGRLVKAGGEASQLESGFLAGAVVMSQLAVESPAAGDATPMAGRECAEDSF